MSGIFPQVSQTFILHHIDRALALGHDVTVYCRRLVPGLSHPVIGKWDLYARIIYSSPRDATALRRVSLAAFRFPVRYWTAVLLRARRKISWGEFFFVMQLGAAPEVFVVNFGTNLAGAARLKRYFFPAARLAVIFHGFDVSAYVRKHGWGRYRQDAALIDLPIAVNRVWADLLERHCGIDNVLVHHLGVRLDQVPVRTGHPGGEFAILFVGRMIEKKGFAYLLEAMGRLSAAGHDVRLHAVGDGPLLPSLKDRAMQLGLADRVTFYGSRLHRFVLEMMSRADCLVAPSVTAADGDSEGIPVTLMEAMACGLPVVSTRHSGIPELVIDGDSGLLTEEGDGDGLFRSIRQLIADADLRDRLAANGRMRIERHFNAAVQDALLFDLIAGTGPSGQGQPAIENASR